MAAGQGSAPSGRVGPGLGDLDGAARHAARDAASAPIAAVSSSMVLTMPTFPVTEKRVWYGQFWLGAALQPDGLFRLPPILPPNVCIFGPTLETVPSGTPVYVCPLPPYLTQEKLLGSNLVIYTFTRAELAKDQAKLKVGDIVLQCMHFLIFYALTCTDVHYVFV